MNDAESLPNHAFYPSSNGQLFRAWRAIRRRFQQPKCALCRQALEQEDYGWYSIWRCRQKHFSEAVLHKA